jgi:hypothetical protein
VTPFSASHFRSTSPHPLFPRRFQGFFIQPTCPFRQAKPRIRLQRQSCPAEVWAGPLVECEPLPDWRGRCFERPRICLAAVA